MFKGDRVWLRQAVAGFKTAICLPLSCLSSNSLWRSRACYYSYHWPYSA
jgi:hypothetical protein